MLKIYNTLSRQKEEFKPLHSDKVGMYVCGVTVYDLCHIGHSRTFMVFDIIARYLRYCGYKLKYVRNITDIDDKIIQRSIENNEDIESLTNKMIAAMHIDFRALNILQPDIEPRATQNISTIIEMIRELLQRKNAYIATNGDIMFDVGSYPDYGILSRQQLTKLKNSERNSSIKNAKRNLIDFVLWKPTRNHDEPSWNSPWGIGRPGWHAECSAMAKKYLGKHFDIHGGGSDLMFPHHENEIAQSYCAYKNHYVNYWIHSGMVTIKNEKMSKSLNNFLTIREILKYSDAETLRYLLISSHYRSPLSYSYNRLNQARRALVRLYTALEDFGEAKIYPKILEFDDVFEQRFRSAMDDDFNTPQACAVLFDISRKINLLKTTDWQHANQLAMCLRYLAGILGLLQQDPQKFLQGAILNDNRRDLVIIEHLISKRHEARKLKDWRMADLIREKLKAMGIILEDGPQATNWRRSKSNL
ncbi:MAG: cysteine--tRNA ligase [Candidatus Dasytiphilus stammeri]